MIQDDTLHILKVKLWLEKSESDDEKSEWRGEIHQLETGEKTYFRHLSGFESGVTKIGIKDIE